MLFACKGDEEISSNDIEEEGYRTIKSAGELAEIQKDNQFQMIMVGASWCAPCLQFKEELATKNFHDFPVYYLDGEAPQFTEYKNQIVKEGFPGSAFYKDGRLMPVNISKAPQLGYSLPGTFSVEELRYIQSNLQQRKLPDLDSFRLQNKAIKKHAEEFSEVFALNPNESWVLSIAYSKKDQMILAGTKSGIISALDSVNGKILGTILDKSNSDGSKDIHDIVIKEVGEKTLMAVTSFDGTLSISSWPTGNLIFRDKKPVNLVEKVYTLPGRAPGMYAEISDDGQFVFATSNSQKVLVVRLNEEKESIYLDGAVNGNRGIDLSPNNETVAFGGRDGVIYLYTTKGWNLKKKLIGHENWVRTVTFDSTGQYLFSGGRDYSARKWLVEDGGDSSVLPVESSRCYKSFDTGHKNPRIIISGSYDGRVRVFDKITSKLLAKMEFDLNKRQGVADVVVSDDGEYLFTGHVNGEVRAWKIPHFQLPPIRIDEFKRDSLSTVNSNTEVPKKITNRDPFEIRVEVFSKFDDDKLTFGLDHNNKITFIKVPSGKIDRTSKRQEDTLKIESFWVSETELTIGQVNSLGIYKPVYENYGKSTAAFSLTGQDIRKILGNLNDKLKREVNILNECEWEYIARAGDNGKYQTGSYGEIEKFGLLQSNSNARPGKVKQLLPNSWGIYDTIGNMREVALYGCDTRNSPGMYVVKGSGWITANANAQYGSARYYSLSRAKKQPYDVDMWIGTRVAFYE